MKCFYHPERDAVGVCKSCGKGLCGECAAEVGGKLACKDKCEDQAKALADFEQGLVRVAAAQKGWLGSGARDAIYYLAYIVIGGVFVWSRSEFLYDPRYPAVVSHLMLTIGVCLIAFGALNILRAVVAWMRLRRAA